MRNRAFVFGFFLLLAASGFAQANPIVPATETITRYTLPAEKAAKSEALYNVSVRLMLASTAYGFVLLLAFLYAHVGSRLRNFSETVTTGVRRQGFLMVPLFLLLWIGLQLPPQIYGHHLSLAYGLSIQRWGSWFGDWGKSLIIEVAVGTAAITGAYALMRTSPRRWWLWFWTISIPFVVFFVFLSPIVIEPLFDKFELLAPRHPQLVAEIEKVAHHGGLDIPPDRMFEMRASRKVTTLNAYVTGIGASKRVVVWDNTIRDLTIPQTLFVFGHEMGHYVMNHIWKGLAFFTVLLFVAYYLGARVGQWAVDRFGPRLGIRGLSDWASLPLLILILAVFSFFTEPVDSAFSRYLEHRADQYGLEVIHGIVPDPNQAAAQAFQALGENSLAYPNPNRLLVFWTYDHPPIADRLEFVLKDKPWENAR